MFRLFILPVRPPCIGFLRKAFFDYFVKNGRMPIRFVPDVISWTVTYVKER